MAPSNEPSHPGDRSQTILLIAAILSLVAIAGSLYLLWNYAKVFLGTDKPESLGWLAALDLLLTLVVPVAIFGAYRMVPANAHHRPKLLMGAVAGILLLFLSLLMVISGYQIFLGGLAEWRKNWIFLGLFLVKQFAGLAVLFGALQAVRTEERSDAVLRRLLYGYNAFLTGVLLVEIILVVNFLAYVPSKPFSYLNSTYDWTEATLHSLSDTNRQFLETLDQTVTVYVLLPEGTLEREFHTLMDNARKVTNKIDVEYYSPDMNLSDVMRLMEKHALEERMGVLLVYGAEGDQKTEFIGINDLVDQSATRPGETPRFLFKGENAFFKKLRYLTEGKTKPVIYFTQGHGEMDLNSFDTSRDDSGLGLLREVLDQRANFEVKELKLGLDEKSVPADAAVVVVARPTRRPSDEMMAALREYMGLTAPAGEGEAKPKRQGKVIFLFDVIKSQDGTMTETVEDLAAELGVTVQKNRLIWISYRDPLTVPVTGASTAQVPAAKSLGSDEELILMRDARGLDAPPSSMGGFRADQMLIVPGRDKQLNIFAETNLAADPASVAQDLLKADPETRNSKLSKTSTPIAFTVSEQVQNPADPTPGHMISNPRAVIFGDSTWVSNRHMRQPGAAEVRAKLFAGSLAWLRERPEPDTSDPKERKAFLITSLDKDSVFWSMVFLPMLFISLGIIGLGASVWVLRRR